MKFSDNIKSLTGGFAINSENQPIAYLTNFPFAQKFDIPLRTDGFNGKNMRHLQIGIPIHRWRSIRCCFNDLLKVLHQFSDIDSEIRFMFIDAQLLTDVTTDVIMSF